MPSFHNDDSFIDAMPKLELHLHIEGSFEPELVFKIAQRNDLEVKAGDRIFNSPEELGEAYKFNNLQEFLDIYYAGMNVLQTEEDFYDLTMAYLEKCDEQNIIHTEIFFDPQGHTSRGVPFDTAINGIHKALKDGEEKFGISSGLIMSYLRHLSEEDAIKTWEDAQPHLDKIIGIGLDSSEKGHPPSKFTNVFKMAKDAGLKVVAHAGEEGPPEYVYEALDILNVDRIDHGNRSLENTALTNRLVQSGMTLTVCPLSNDKLQVVKDMDQHPIKHMLDLGLNATVNSDDPAYFGGYMNENFKAVHDHLGLTREEMYKLTDNAINGSFASDERKKEMRAALDAHMLAYAQTLIHENGFDPV